ncbi:unnamed protein product [Parajaminaea phylloscopi]
MDGSGQLAAVTDWSQALHSELLGRSFTLRPAPSEEQQCTGVAPRTLLFKTYCHHPSKTVAVVVVALDTFAVLYEGMSFRTLQRRLKVTGDGGTNVSTASFAELAQLMDTTVAPQSQDEVWLDCELERSEASVTFHHRLQSPARRHVTFACDLSSLGRDEGPAFLREHLVFPLAALAASNARSDQGSVASTKQGIEALACVLQDASSRQTFATVAQLAAGAAADASPTISAQGETQRSIPADSELEPTTPQRRRRAVPEAAANVPTAEPAGSSDRRPPAGLGSSPPSGSRRNPGRNKDNADEDEEMIVFRPTPSSSASRDTRSGPSSRSSRRTTDSAPRHRRQGTPDRQGTPTPARESQGAKSLHDDAANGHAADDSDTDGSGTEEEADVTLGRSAEAKRGLNQLASSERGLSRSLSRSPSAMSAALSETPAPQPTFESIPSLPPSRPPDGEPANLVRSQGSSSQAVFATDAPQVSQPRPGESVAATAPRGTINYQRGLAKRKRI